jgi:hypothetical protein
MRKPDFFIVGAPKCGTTAMNDYLKQHPEIYIPDKKEFYFFGADINSSSRVNTEEKYLSYFSSVVNEKRVGESSVWYLYSKLAAAEIRSFSPSASIIVMLRNPVDMLYSLHSQFVYEVLENITDFQEAIEAEEDRKRGLRIPDGPQVRGRHFTKELLFYREVAKYTTQIQRYFDVFGRENVHVIIFDDFKSDVAREYRETLCFLGVNESFQANFKIINSNKRLRSTTLKKFLLSPPPIVLLSRKLFPHKIKHLVYHSVNNFNVVHEDRKEMLPELRKCLQREFLCEVDELSKLLNRDLTYWCRD